MERNRDDAIRLLHLPAYSGYDDARNELGMTYECEPAGEEDAIHAVELFRKAERRGCLGFLLTVGPHTPFFYLDYAISSAKGLKKIRALRFATFE